MEIATSNTTKGFISKLHPTSIQFPSELLAHASTEIEKTEIPTTRNEAWKYTRLGKISKSTFTNEMRSFESIDSFKVEGAVATFVFINGHYSSLLSETSSIDRASWKLLSECTPTDLSKPNIALEDNLFNCINTAYLNDGLLLNVSDAKQSFGPIQIIHIVSGKNIISNFRTIINQRPFTKVEVIQGFYSLDAEGCFVNSITDVNLETNSFLKLHKIQSENESGYHISSEKINQQKDSNATINTITLDGGLVRNNINIEVNGENSETHLNGAYILKNRQHIDNHTTIDHKVANCQSNELYKGVIDDNATAVFNGKVFVRKDAQKINAFQSNANVLLSENATINSKPELEIYADDVKCSHGSTTGQLDDEAIFYLRARGISEKSAKQLMISAFIGDVLNNISNENVLTKTQSLINERFGWDL